MATEKVAITLEKGLLKEVDRLVAHKFFPNRSQAIASAVRNQVNRLEKTRLIAELAKLDSSEERGLAEEWGEGEAPWPKY